MAIYIYIYSSPSLCLIIRETILILEDLDFDNGKNGDTHASRLFSVSYKRVIILEDLEFENYKMNP